jgi:hypothetical protein
MDARFQTQLTIDANAGCIDLKVQETVSSADVHGPVRNAVIKQGEVALGSGTDQ